MDGREPLVHRCVRELRYEGAVSPPCPLSETSTWPNTLSRPSMVSPLCTWRASSPWPQPFIVITLDKPPQTVSIFPCPRPTSGRRPFNYIMVPICGTPLSASTQNVSTISAFNSFVNPFLFATYNYNDPFAWSIYCPTASFCIIASLPQTPSFIYHYA